MELIQATEKIPHPAVQILLWMELLAIIQMLSGWALLLLAVGLSLLAFKLGRDRFKLLLQRTRWIVLSLLLIYAFATHGEPVLPQLGRYSPVLEGLHEGMLQLLRILAVLASLSVLLSLLTRAQFLSGLYTLMRPLGFLGLSRERIAVRLALTLEYAETSLSDKHRNWRAELDSMLTRERQHDDVVELAVQRLSTADRLWLMLLIVILIGLWL